MPLLRVLELGSLLLGLGACSEAQASVCASLDTAAVVSVDLDDGPHCLGSVVEAAWVLTAAHCMAGVEPRRLTVRDDADHTARVRDIVLRVDASAGLGALDGRDLALLRLDASLGTPVEVASPRPEDVCAVQARSRRPLDAPLRALEEATIFTAPRTRPGDSGGPLFDLRGGLIGVASWRADDGGPSVFTRVDANEDWLWETIDG